MSEKELEIERLKLEQIKVAAGRHELSFYIKQRRAEITRFEANIKIQLDREAELESKIQQLSQELGA